MRTSAASTCFTTSPWAASTTRKIFIWWGNERITGSYVSLKRQEPTPKGESVFSIAITQSSLCEDINIKRPQQPPKFWRGLRRISDSRWLPPQGFFLLSVILCAQRDASSPGDTTRAYEDPLESPKYFIRLHQKHFLSILLISYLPWTLRPPMRLHRHARVDTQIVRRTTNRARGMLCHGFVLPRSACEVFVLFRQCARVGCRRSLLWDRPVATARRCFVRRRCRCRCPGHAPRSDCGNPLRCASSCCCRSSRSRS
jgi:hypothetical protein